MPEASPTKWHLAHSTWFFETFLLQQAEPGFDWHEPAFQYLFNSYYNQVGDQFPRPQRGLLTRPGVEEINRYRRAVDERVLKLLEGFDEHQWRRFEHVVHVGLHHEQQHQELILTDIKHLLWLNPLRPVYRAWESAETQRPMAKPSDNGHGSSHGAPERWIGFEAGVYEVGHEGEGFCYDNETPRHKRYLQAFRIMNRPVTNGQFLAFLRDGGYERSELWLSDGWDRVQAEGWKQPLYWWRDDDERWRQFTLAGDQPLRMDEPVTHLSYFEAEAYARWRGLRLPSEAEWEVAVSRSSQGSGEGLWANLQESGRFHPCSLVQGAGSGDPPGSTQGILWRAFGDVWEWTASQYTPYPGYQPEPGALGEYNGKFMCNQFVLRGGSCVTPAEHTRLSYRNFFPPEARWQFTGLRLARDA